MRYALLLSLLIALPGLAQSRADAITGVWLTAEKDGYVQIFEEDGRYFGKSVGAPPDTRGDSDRDLLGIRVLKGFEYNGESRWENGRAYDPGKDKSYDAWMTLKDPDTLKLRGYIGISLLGRTEVWTRAGRDAKGVESSELVATD